MVKVKIWTYIGKIPPQMYAGSDYEKLVKFDGYITETPQICNLLL